MKYAIDKNGWVKIEFYHERENKPFQYNPGSITWVNGNNYGSYDLYSSTCSASKSNVRSVDTVLNAATCYYDASSSITASSACTDRCEVDASIDSLDLDINANRSLHKRSRKSIETGRVEKGSRSNQEFEYCDIDFEYYSFKTESIHILPTSQKKVSVEETRRKYCSQCGKKVSPKDKFCSNCGAKLN